MLHIERQSHKVQETEVGHPSPEGRINQIPGETGAQQDFLKQEFLVVLITNSWSVLIMLWFRELEMYLPLLSAASRQFAWGLVALGSSSGLCPVLLALMFPVILHL